MGTIKGTIASFCISFLAIYWSGVSLGVSASVLPLHRHATLSSSSCDCCGTSPISQNPSYERISSPSLISGDTSAAQKQQLLSQASILLKQLSPAAAVGSLNIDSPCDYAIENQEKILLQNLVNRLESIKQSSALATTTPSTLPAVSQATYNSIGNQYLEIRLLALDLLTSRDAEVVQSALDALYKTFVNIITGQLLNSELPNLCSKTLALNSQLAAIDAPTELQDAVVDLIKSLTLALTGQSQVTILGLCDCLNDLETSVVTVVENDESQKLQYLLSNLVEAVTNAVVSGGDVGCNVINTVKRYAASIKQAIQEDTNVRAGKIYNSVLNFEEELYQVLIASDPTAIATTTPSSETTTSSDLETEEDYVTEIGQLAETIFGNSTGLVRSAVKILLDIKKTEDPAPQDETTTESTEATLESLKKVENLLKSVSLYPQTDSTRVVEGLVKLLSTLPETDVTKILDALDPVPEDNSDTDSVDDATAIVTNGELFVIKQLLVEKTDDEGNVIEIAQNGTFQLVDPTTDVVWTGNYTVQGGTIQSDPDGNLAAEGYGVYDVFLPQDDSSTSRVKRQANFILEDNAVVQIDENGRTDTTEGGTYTLRDAYAGTSKSGNFVVENSVSKANPDGSIVIIKSGLLYVDDPDATSPSEVPPLEDGSVYFLFNDRIFESPDNDGNLGIGIYSIKNAETNEAQTGTYVIQELTKTENPDGSVDSTTSGLIYVKGLDIDSPNSDPDLFVANGSQFTFDDHLTYVTDTYGHVSPISTGEFTAVDPETGTSSSRSYVTKSIITAENPDGSTDITKFGTLSGISVTTSSTESPTTPSSSSEPDEPIIIGPVKPWPISKDSFESLINSLNPVKQVQPSTGLSTTQSPTTTDPTIIPGDATSIVASGTSFIIDEVITPVLDPEGNVIDKLTTGTYHLTNYLTNMSCSGAFDVEDSSLKTTSLGNVELTASGTFDVSECRKSGGSDFIGKFSIEDQLSSTVNENGTAVTNEGGTYYLTDSTTGVSKSGTYVVENTVSRPRSDGAIELIKSGLLFVDESDGTTTSPSKEPLIPGYDGYFLCDDHIYNAPDSDGNYGTGVYSVKDSRTNEYSSGTYVIQQISIENNTDGSIVTKKQGVIYVDGSDPDSSSGNTAYPSIITNGATFTMEDHLAYVTDPYGHTTLVGTGQYTQVNPETGVTESESHVILNVATANDDDGSTRFTKLGVFPIDNELDSESTKTTQASTESTSTTPAPTESTSTTQASAEGSSTTKTSSISNPHKPLVLKKDYLDTLVNSLNPIHSDHTQEVPSLIVSTSGNPFYDATAIVTNGSYFIIDGQVVTQRDDEGNVVGLVKTGSFSIRDSQTNTSWTGNFEVEDFSIESITDGQTNSQTDITAAGTFDVVRPIDSSIITTITRNHANFSIKDLLTVVIDETGETSATEEGTYSLVDPITGDSSSGNFVVRNSLSKVNSDNSIDIVKSGILYVDEPSATAAPSETTVPSEPSNVIKYGGYFLTDQHLLSVPDSNGNYGTGVYNIKDAVTNEYTSGTYVIKKASVVNNTDGTQDVTTAGLIYVDSSRSSSTSINTDPSLAIIDGAEFEFVDHLSFVTDPYGRITVVGTGVFTQTDPKSNTVRSGKYVIQDIVTNDNPDGSQDGIESGIFYYTSDSPATTTTCSDDSTVLSTPSLTPNTNLHDLKVSLQTVVSYLEELKAQTKPASSQSSSSNVAPTTTSGSTSAIAVSDTQIIPNSVVLQRSSVVSAINGQCLSPGDVVIVQTNNGAALIATIQDSSSPVTFYVTNLADLTNIYGTATKIWNAVENDFSKQDRSLIDAVLTSTTRSPCST